MEPRIVEAVGFAHKPGRNTIKADIWRAFMRMFVWVLFRRYIPLDFRQRAMFFVLNFRSRFLRLSFLGGASKGNTFENDLLKLIFNATPIADIADNDATSPLTNIQWSLHTADPGEAGDQTTSEVTYTSYARVAVARTSGGHTVTTNSVSPVATVSFPQGSGGSGTATHFAVGTASSGAGKLLYSGTVTPNIVTGNLITPQLATSSTITED
jgi:hypothetical protein